MGARFARWASGSRTRGCRPDAAPSGRSIAAQPDRPNRAVLCFTRSNDFEDALLLERSMQVAAPLEIVSH
jgi:hypothetical protein